MGINQKTFICECKSLEHQITFRYFDDEDMLYVSTHLITHKNIFKRIWVAIKYIFGYKSRYGNWDEFIFEPNDIDKLNIIIREIKKNRTNRDTPTN